MNEPFLSKRTYNSPIKKVGHATEKKNETMVFDFTEFKDPLPEAKEESH